ncbi:hypothetical protein WA158_001571 [Blastocystis sp. Blastoise]
METKQKELFHEHILESIEQFLTTYEVNQPIDQLVKDNLLYKDQIKNQYSIDEKAFNDFYDKMIILCFRMAYQNSIQNVVDECIDEIKESFRKIMCLSLDCARSEWKTSTQLPFTLMSDAFDGCNVEFCEQLWSVIDVLKSKILQPFFVDVSSFTMGILYILRLTNRLLRRASRTENTSLRFLASVFPITHVSGWSNQKFSTLSGHDIVLDPKDIAIENLDNDLCREFKVDYDTYAQFWSLQQYLSNPSSLMIKDSGLDIWNTKVKILIMDILQLFSRFPVTLENTVSSISRKKITINKIKFNMNDENKDSQLSRVPLYSPSSSLFLNQLQDISFRRDILVQITILLDYLDFDPVTSSYMSSTTDTTTSPIPVPPLPNTKNDKSPVINTNNNMNNTNNNTIKGNSISSQNIRGNPAVIHALTPQNIFPDLLDIKMQVIDTLKESGDEGKHFAEALLTHLDREHNWVSWKSHNKPAILPIDTYKQPSTYMPLNSIKQLNNQSEMILESNSSNVIQNKAIQNYSQFPVEKYKNMMKNNNLPQLSFLKSNSNALNYLKRLSEESNEDLSEYKTPSSYHKPTPEEHIEYMMYYFDPANGMEQEYHPRKDKIYCWRNIRLSVPAKAYEYSKVKEYQYYYDIETFTQCIYRPHDIEILEKQRKEEEEKKKKENEKKLKEKEEERKKEEEEQRRLRDQRRKEREEERKRKDEELQMKDSINQSEIPTSSVTVDNSYGFSESSASISQDTKDNNKRIDANSQSYKNKRQSDGRESTKNAHNISASGTPITKEISTKETRSSRHSNSRDSHHNDTKDYSSVKSSSVHHSRRSNQSSQRSHSKHEEKNNNVNNNNVNDNDVNSDVNNNVHNNNNNDNTNVNNNKNHNNIQSHVSSQNIETNHSVDQETIRSPRRSTQFSDHNNMNKPSNRYDNNNNDNNRYPQKNQNHSNNENSNKYTTGNYNSHGLDNSTNNRDTRDNNNTNNNNRNSYHHNYSNNNYHNEQDQRYDNRSLNPNAKDYVPNQYKSEQRNKYYNNSMKSNEKQQRFETEEQRKRSQQLETIQQMATELSSQTSSKKRNHNSEESNERSNSRRSRK